VLTVEFELLGYDHYGEINAQSVIWPYVIWFQLAQDKIQWSAVLITVMQLFAFGRYPSSCFLIYNNVSETILPPSSDKKHTQFGAIDKTARNSLRS
jgi:hypothetical protein